MIDKRGFFNLTHFEKNSQTSEHRQKPTSDRDHLHKNKKPDRIHHRTGPRRKRFRAASIEGVTQPNKTAPARGAVLFGGATRNRIHDLSAKPQYLVIFCTYSYYI
jgi:hypothetical protein